jgi:hypothetical protein
LLVLGGFVVYFTTLEPGHQNVFRLLYRELRDDSNATLTNLYEAWNKLEKANDWRAKLPLTEAVEE